MKRTIGWLVLCCAVFASNSFAQESLQAALGPGTPIPANSESMYEFRGSAAFTYEPYTPGEPPHVHVDRDEKSAKFWLNPALACNFGFSAQRIG